MTQWIVSTEESGLTVLALLQRRLPGAPQAYLRQLLRKNKIKSNGTALAEEHPLTAGDRVELPESQRFGALAAQERDSAVDILYESREILVAFKPSGLAVHRTQDAEEDNLADRVQALLRRRGEKLMTAPVHRLDRETSGPVLFGKGRQAISTLGVLFTREIVDKEYLALALGTTVTCGRMESPVPAKGKLKEAATEFRTHETAGGFSLLALRLLSGRTHQIRKHLADAGHPIAGDRRYRGPALAGLQRMFLHCARLGMRNPFDDSRLEVHCPLPPELQSVLEQLGYKQPGPTTQD